MPSTAEYGELTHMFETAPDGSFVSFVGVGGAHDATTIFFRKKQRIWVRERAHDTANVTATTMAYHVYKAVEAGRAIDIEIAAIAK